MSLTIRWSRWSLPFSQLGQTAYASFLNVYVMFLGACPPIDSGKIVCSYVREGLPIHRTCRLLVDWCRTWNVSLLGKQMCHLICSTNIMHRVHRAEGIPCRWMKHLWGQLPVPLPSGINGKVLCERCTTACVKMHAIWSTPSASTLPLASYLQNLQRFLYVFFGCGFRNLERRSNSSILRRCWMLIWKPP